MVGCDPSQPFKDTYSRTDGYADALRPRLHRGIRFPQWKYRLIT